MSIQASGISLKSGEKPLSQRLDEMNAEIEKGAVLTERLRTANKNGRMWKLIRNFFISLGIPLERKDPRHALQALEKYLSHHQNTFFKGPEGQHNIENLRKIINTLMPAKMRKNSKNAQVYVKCLSILNYHTPAGPNKDQEIQQLKEAQEQAKKSLEEIQKKLDAAVSDSNQKAQDLGKLQKEVQDAQNRSVEAQEKLKKAEEDLTAAKAANTPAGLKEAEAKLAAATKEKDVLTQAVEDSKKLLDTKEKEKAEIQEKLDQAIEKLKVTAGQGLNLNAEKELAQKEIEKLRSDLRNANNRIVEIQEEKKLAEGQLKSSLTELSDRIGVLTKELEETHLADEKRKEESRKLLESKEEIAKIQAELNKVKEESEKKNVGFEASIILEEKLAKLNGELEAAQKQIADIDTHPKVIETLKLLEVAVGESSRAKIELEGKEKELSDCKADLEFVNQNVEGFKKELDQAKFEIEKLKKAQSDTAASFEKAKAKKQELKKTKKQLNEDNDKYRETVQRAMRDDQLKIGTLEASLKEANDSLAAEKEKESKLNELVGQLKEAAELGLDGAKDLKAVNAAYEQLTAENAKLIKSNKKLKEWKDARLSIKHTQILGDLDENFDGLGSETQPEAGSIEGSAEGEKKNNN